MATAVADEDPSGHDHDFGHKRYDHDLLRVIAQMAIMEQCFTPDMAA